ncbi:MULTISPECIES: exonuclease SbcCD subunit D [Chryseobacterium]|uniref:Nuclease SbcCD subunit D n=1 Tax=Chryseobacterium taihuense TaxID=1141221 RepID=A0A4U8WLA4_9FLAO|nr:MULTISPECIES: exonuclease SbcCD subunit D [Chryseobacterium]QQV03112.1 exonuclease SbcCD subunit D [Chryseobacterium sp. FDAARGOS 1104]VFB03588.1 Nuclease sbcCD subunit D [Chryseobacterium taihuense]
MKILHTADWHLGKRLDRFSRLEEQVLVMDEIVQIADEQNVDLVLIAGDLFDNFNPGVEAVELFYKTLKRLSLNGKRPVIAISGNHDSPSLIDAPDPLARECGIILIGHPKATIHPFELEHFKIAKSAQGFIELQLRNQNFPVRILHTPYANEIRLKEYFGEDKSVALNAVLAEHWKKTADEFCDNNGVNLLMTHLYMNKKGEPILDEPEGEKPIKIGNADLIFSDIIPTQIQYTALGHLHRFQNIGTNEKPVVYSSSPLCYSFSEAGQTKYVSIIEAEPDKQVLFEKIAVKNGRCLERKTFDGVEKTVEWLQENPNSLVEITLESQAFLKAEERKKIYQAHNGIIYLIPKFKNQQFNENTLTEINLSRDPMSLFIEYFKCKNSGQEPNEELLNLFKEIETIHL